MEELLAGIDEDERALRPLRQGELVEGVVASVSGDEALVDLGGRSAGVLSLRERAEKERMSRSATGLSPPWSSPKVRTAASSSPHDARGAGGSGDEWPSS